MYNNETCNTFVHLQTSYLATHMVQRYVEYKVTPQLAILCYVTVTLSSETNAEDT